MMQRPILLFDRLPTATALRLAEARWLRRRACVGAFLLGALALVGTSGCLEFQQGPVKLGNPKDFAVVDGQKIYVEEMGPKDARDTILLVHGFGATGRGWLFIEPALKQRYRVLVVDMPGFGRSDKYPGDYSGAATAKKAFAVLDARGAKRVHLVCHSYGTAVCLAMALQAPRRVQTLTLISSFAYEDQLPPFLTWARVPLVGELLFGLMWNSRIDDRMNYAFYNPDKFIYPAAIDEARKLMELPGALAASLATVRGMDFSMHTRYRTLPQPALVISGRDDPVTRLPSARRLVNDLPNARHLVISQCGHVPFVEQPAKVIQGLLAFLHQHETPPPPPPKQPPASAPSLPPAEPDEQEEVAFQ
jgi:pimeloyl-ACP methyl ester carboxylesterase